MMKIQNRSPFKPKARTGYRIEDKAGEATVFLYDEIGFFGITAEEFVRDLEGITADTINLRINSPGGSVFDGTAIYNAIKTHKSKIVAHIDGLAASISSIIAMAADEVRMADNAFLMIHEPWSIVMGNALAMRDEAELLDKVGGTIAKAYMKKTGKDEAEVMEMMIAESWMTADEALSHKFIDSIYEDKPKKARADLFDLSIFNRVPDALKDDGDQEPTVRDMERALRDVGCSSKQAKAILAGWHDTEPRDVVSDAVDPATEKDEPRDVAPPDPKVKRSIADLLIHAETIAPSRTSNHSTTGGA